MTVYSNEDIIKYLHGKHKLIYIIGMHNGLRISDVLNLRVKHGLQPRSWITEIKTGKHKRIYIPTRIRQDLEKLCAGRPADDYIFTSDGGKHITRQAVWRAFKRAAAQTGQNINVGTHSMRKSYANKLLRTGKSYKEIQAKLNHEQLGDTLRYLVAPPTKQKGKKK